MKLTQLVFIFLLLNILSSFSSANEIPLTGSPVLVNDFTALKAIKIKADGTIMSLQTYADQLIHDFSDGRFQPKDDNITTFAKIIFADPQSLQYQLFYIDNQSIQDTLGLNSGLLSFKEIAPHLTKLKSLYDAAVEIDPKYQGGVERSIIKLYDNVQLFNRLNNSFASFIQTPEFNNLSDDIITITQLDPQKKEYAYIDLVFQSNHLNQVLTEIQFKSEEERTLTDRKVIELLLDMYYFPQNTELSALTIIPDYNTDSNWHDPQEIVFSMMTDPFYIQIIETLEIIYNSAIEGNNNAFKDSIYKLTQILQDAFPQYTNTEQTITNDEISTSTKDKANFAYLIVFVTIFLAILIPLLKKS